MPKRLTRIATRTGDDGTTGLADGRRLAKDHPRIDAIGSIDELNSMLGMLRALSLPAAIDRSLEGVQHRLFDLGGELALPGSQALDDPRVGELDRDLEAFNAGLPPLEEFVLPGGNEGAARSHLARTVCRRAERDLLRLSRVEPVNLSGIRYLNRLSDLLFVMARVLARRDGGAEITWKRDT
ncbi:MAG: cob(I)yrinic acid a,c-diamide adenosyltransferase [Chromatiaceae bacterium]|nr:cob(I)yrinic acid a,c-diamide adenosyltransferase [Gammaproteobacteria bacterium]MCP5313879.1 cob(I)yrinic acid a,c-diamide adenosyltransferase [Chromatiaceae bacterium]